MNDGHHGPWQRVGVPANLLQRWRHPRVVARVGRGAARAVERLALRNQPRNVRPRLDPGEDVPDGGIMTDIPRRKRMARRFRLKRKRRSRRGRRRNYRTRTAFPFKVVKVLKTVKYLSLNPGAAGAIATNYMIANSAYDPTGGVGAGQPLGFDQWAALYERYAVIRSRIFVEATSVDTTNPQVVGCHVDKQVTGATTYEHFKELPMTVCRLMTPDQDKVTFSISAPISKIYGHRKFLSDDRLSPYITADPTDKVYYEFFAQPVDQSSDGGVCHLVITVYQTVVFFMPKPIARS